MWVFDLDALPLLAPIVTATAMVVQAWIRHRTAKLREKSRNERHDRLLGGCTPSERAEILRALQRNQDLRRER